MDNCMDCGTTILHRGRCVSCAHKKTLRDRERCDADIAAKATKEARDAIKTMGTMVMVSGQADRIKQALELIEKLETMPEPPSNEWWYTCHGHHPDTNVDAYYVYQGKSRISGRMFFHEAIALVAIHNCSLAAERVSVAAMPEEDK